METIKQHYERIIKDGTFTPLYGSEKYLLTDATEIKNSMIDAVENRGFGIGKIESDELINKSINDYLGFWPELQTWIDLRFTKNINN